MKKFLSAICTATILLSSVPVLGTARDIINQEVLQITAFKDNGQVGKASYYGGNGHHGRKTASGKVFDKNAMTCAHMTLPFGTKLKITNIKTGESVIVEVTDRGNFAKHGRIVDLSEGAFKKIAPLKQGVVKVKLEKL